MVRADVNDIVIISKQAVLCFCKVTISIEIILYCIVALRFVCQRELVCLRTHVKVLTQWVALEVSTQEETTHVWMTEELDAYEVEDLTFKQVSTLPKVYYCRYYVAAVHLLCYCAYGASFVVLCILEDVDTSETFFAEVLTDYGNKVVEMFLVLKP